MSSAGFETTIPVIKWLQTYAVDRTASGIRLPTITYHYVLVFNMSSAGFETTIPVIKWLQTYAVDRTASEIRLPTITHHYVLAFRCPVLVT